MLALVLCSVTGTSAAQNQKRNRGEAFYSCQNSNTPGPGSIWLSFVAVGHIWDDDAIMTDTNVNPVVPSNNSAPVRKWISNVRAFPEVNLMAGITDYLSIYGDSRLLSYGFRPGYFRGGIKVTIPDNRELRFHGFGMTLSYKKILRESAPSLGGYTGFMPEGFFVKGNNIEWTFIHEMDLLQKTSLIPLRFITNVGLRQPVDKRTDMRQMLADIMLVYSGYGYDFYAGYSLESFMNFFAPVEVNQDNVKRFLVWFGENPMYLNLGGNIRYDNGVTLSLTVPMLLSVNHGSRMRNDDLVELNRHTTNGKFMYEKDRGIKDPFDPWFVKWKVSGAITFPVRFTSTGSEMMRNYLLLKNRKNVKTINIEERIDLEAGEKQKPDEEKMADEKRLEEIRKRREALNK